MSFKRNIKIIGIIIVLLVGGMLVYSNYIKKGGYMMKISVIVEGNLTHVNAASADSIIVVAQKEVYKSEVPDAGTVRYPGMTVGIIDQNLTLVSNWRNERYNGSGTYEIDVELNREIKKGETIKVIVYIFDAKKNRIAGLIRHIKIANQTMT